MQFNTVNALLLNILNYVTSDPIFILLLLTYQKQLAYLVFVAPRSIQQIITYKSTVIMERVYSTIEYSLYSLNALRNYCLLTIILTVSIIFI